MKNINRKKLLISCFAILSVIVLGFLAFGGNKTVDKTVAVNVYADGEIIESSTIKISGNIKNSVLTSERSFVGIFAMEYYEKSCREGVETKIKWGDGYESIQFFYAGDFTHFDVKGIKIDKEMESIMVSLEDGTIIATPMG